MGGKSRDNTRSVIIQNFFIVVLEFFCFSEVGIRMLAFCCNTFLTALALFFFAMNSSAHMFIASTLTASRHLELQTEMLVPNKPAFIAIEPYFKTSKKLISVISPFLPIRNASKTCRRFAHCYFASQQFHPFPGINYLT